MGIENFNKLLNETCNHVFQKDSIKRFSGTRIAFDGFLVGYSNMSKVHKEMVLSTNPFITRINTQERTKLWILRVLQFYNEFLKYNITPIVVFDGGQYPEKAETKKERVERKKDEYEKIRLLQEKYDKDRDNIRIEDITEMRKLVSNCFSFEKTDWENLKKTLYFLGIPTLTSTYEGEQLAAMLAIEGHVSAVYTMDTDVYAWGAPVVVTGFGGWQRDEDGASYPLLQIVELKDIKNGLRTKQDEPFTFNQLQELCILMGCDFNRGVAGIGYKTAFKYMSEYKSIENMQAHFPQKDWSGVHTERCKEIFAYTSSALLIQDNTYTLDIIRSMFDDHVAQVFSKLELSMLSDDLSAKLKKSMTQNMKYITVTMNVPVRFPDQGDDE